MNGEVDEVLPGMIVEATVSAVRPGSLALVASRYIGHLPAPEMSWNVRECDTSRYAVGDRIRVYVVAAEFPRFSASLKLLSPERDPWRIAETLSVGDLVRGTVVRCWRWGAEVTIEGGFSAVWVLREGEQAVVGTSFCGRVRLLDRELRKVEVQPC